MRYTLELGDDGRRYWRCTLGDGTDDMLPPEFAIALHSEVRELEDGRVVALPLGTTVTVEVPADPKAVEEAAIRRVLLRSLKESFARAGKILSDEDAEEILTRSARELLEGSASPAIERARAAVGRPEPPSIVKASAPELDLVERLRKAGFGLRR